MANSINKKSVDEIIYECLDLDKPKSFFLFAGAGSGKTRSLVEVLKRFRGSNISKLRLNGQRIAIITYTNAACDEIMRRLEFDPAFSISTIHSFAWQLINSYTIDIKEWLTSNLAQEISELDEKLAKAKNLKGKTALDNAAKREVKISRLDNLVNISTFSYNPSGTNSEKNSLNHTEVISIASSFLLEYKLMRTILVRKFPILLIDESQDTKKELIDAFFSTQDEKKNQFCLGLFGDTMQRIYSDGKIDLGNHIPGDWAQPEKNINYRCPTRIVELINKIRSEVDEHQQEPAKTSDGFVRLFIIDTNLKQDRFTVESIVSEKMSEITTDVNWTDTAQVKTLTLEHHMAANRGGFSDLFIPLYSVKKLSTGVLDGTLRGMPFFTQQLLPLVHATRAEDEFSIAQVVRKHSPMLSSHELERSESQIKQIKKAEKAVNSVKSLWEGENNPTLISIMKEVAGTGLFLIPDIFAPFLKSGFDTTENSSKEIDESDDKVLIAWESALSATLHQLESYFDYISERSGFGTHQGIKGLEFPRVMVILDDEESKGFLFSYEKLFGAKAPTATDIKNESEGKDTGIDRTRRLFYVTCSRAEESLAIVAYTNSPSAVKKYALSQGWFYEHEIVDDI